MFRRMTFRWLAGLFLTGGLIGLAMTAQADPNDPTADAKAASDKKHCAVQLEPVQEGGKEVSEMTDLGCYPTFAEAIAAGTGGAVRLSEGVTPETITEADIGPDAVIIGIDYDRPFFGGRSLTWFGRNGGCFFFRFFANMPFNFNNRLTSTRAFSGCRRNDSFSGFNQSGFFVRCFPNCAYIGDFLNNATSSKRWLR